MRKLFIWRTPREVTQEEHAKGDARASPSWLRRSLARSHARSLANRNELAGRINFNNLIQELLLGNHVTEVTLTLS